MNFSAVRGYNAYALLSAKVREAVKGKADDSAPASGAARNSRRQADGQDYSHSIYSEPVDTVTISEPARKAANALTLSQLALSPAQQEDIPQESGTPVVLRENSPHTEFRKWLKTTGTMGSSGVISGGFTYKIPGRVMNDALLGSSISVDDDEEYSIDIDLLSTVTVSGRNAEKARAIQNLLNSTPSGINWGMLLATLPPRL